MPAVSEETLGEAAVTIGRHRVGRGLSTFVVAEAGVNHNGRIETALRMVDAAKDAGADAVKFQMFRADDLVASGTDAGGTGGSGTEAGGAGARSQLAMLAALELPYNDFFQIEKHCRDREITFLATPFGIDALAALTKLGAPAVKIASTDLINRPLIEAAAESGLTVILSTGASTTEETREAVSTLTKLGAGARLVLLHCVSRYPTPVEHLNLRAINTLREAFHVPCGLSDHTTSIQTGGWAVAAGACVVEKHFTLEREQAGPDHAMSLNPAQLREYVACIRQAERALGHGCLGMTEAERETRQVAGRSVVAACDIPAGTRLTAEVLALKRPGTGIAPAQLEDLLGRRTRVAIPRDAVLAWDMVE